MKKAKKKYNRYVKYPLGGINDTNFDPNSPDYQAYGQKEQTANTIQSTAEKIPVYGQLIGMGKQFSETGANIVGRDTSLGKGIIQGRPDQAGAQLVTDFKQGNWGSAAANLATGGASEFAKPFFGQGSFTGNLQNKMQDKMQDSGFSIGNGNRPFANGGSIMNTTRLYDKPNYTTPYLFKFPMGGIKYAEGGTGEMSAEVEKQENAISPNGQFTQYNGPSHEQGGIKTDLPNQSIIFSDRLKPEGSKLTYAELNKPNNTKKEDKVLEDKAATTESRKTAELMKGIKSKNSQELFEDQEANKAYDLHSGLYKFGGMVEYKKGSIHIKPSKVGTFTRWAKSHGMSVSEAASKVMANKDNYSSSIVKKANFAKNASGWKHGNGGIIETPEAQISHKILVNGLKYPDGGIYYSSGHNSITGNPMEDRRQWKIQQEGLGYKQVDDSTFLNPNTNQKINYFPQQETGYSPAGQDISGTGLFKNPQGQQFYYGNGNYQPYQGKGTIPVESKFTKGGFMSGYSKYPWGGFNSDIGDAVNYANYGRGTSQYWPSNASSYNPDVQQFYTQGPNSGDQVSYPGNKFNKYGAYKSAIDYANSGNPDKEVSDMFDTGSYAGEGSPSAKNTSNKSNDFNWKDAAYYGAGTLANSAGPLAYLKEQGKKYDTQKFYDYNPSKLDPAAALRDHQLQINAATSDLSRYNSGNYMANRVALGANAAQGQAGIRTDYDNRNNMIANDAQQFNIRNHYMTDDINARNKGAALTNYYNAVGQVGTNTASGMRDYRANQMDDQRMGMLKYIYNNPEFLKMLQNYKG